MSVLTVGGWGDEWGRGTMEAFGHDGHHPFKDLSCIGNTSGI